MTDTIPDQYNYHIPQRANKIFLVCLTRPTPRAAQRQRLWDHGCSHEELGASLRGCICTSPSGVQGRSAEHVAAPAKRRPSGTATSHCHMPLPPPCSSGSPSKHVLDNHTERGCPMPRTSRGLEESSLLLSQGAPGRFHSGFTPIGLYRGVLLCLRGAS